MRYRSDKYRPNQRPVESKKEDPIFKYFIIFEGEKTESSYLEALRGVSKKHPFVMVEKKGNEKGLTLLNQMIGDLSIVCVRISNNINRHHYFHHSFWS